MTGIYLDEDYWQQRHALELERIEAAEAQADDDPPEAEPVAALGWAEDDDDDDHEDDDDAPLMVFDDRNNRVFTNGADPYDRRDTWGRR